MPERRSGKESGQGHYFMLNRSNIPRPLTDTLIVVDNNHSVKQLLFLASIIVLRIPASGMASSNLIRPNSVTFAPLQLQQCVLTRFCQHLTRSGQPSGMGTITLSALYTATRSREVAFIEARRIGS